MYLKLGDVNHWIMTIIIFTNYLSKINVDIISIPTSFLTPCMFVNKDNVASFHNKGFIQINKIYE